MLITFMCKQNYVHAQANFYPTKLATTRRHIGYTWTFFVAPNRLQRPTPPDTNSPGKVTVVGFPTNRSLQSLTITYLKSSA